VLEKLTSAQSDVIHSNMKAKLILRERITLDDDMFVELIVWHLPERLAGSQHDFKYRLALVRENICVMRYDNEAGKGDHKHSGESEIDYRFSGLDQLQSDFWDDVQAWRQK
jgi:Family of unknown function (DUF6516)